MSDESHCTTITRQKPRVSRARLHDIDDIQKLILNMKIRNKIKINQS